MHQEIHSLKHLNEQLLKEIEHFFESYNEINGKQFEPIGRHGPQRAEKLVRKATKRLRENSRGEEDALSKGNGKVKQQGG